MGIYQIRNTKTWQNWTSKEKQILIENKERKTIEDIRKLMPYRTWQSISCKAYELGINKKQLKVNKLNQFEKGWIAALVDGEGTVTLHRSKLKNGETGYHPRLMIGNTNRELIEKVKTVIGSGHISRCKSKNEQKPLWAYELSSRPLEKLLPQITNHLIVKKRQAEIVSEVIKINRTFIGGKRKFITSKELSKLTELNEELLPLNRRVLNLEKNS
jgi:hypothetical protein